MIDLEIAAIQALTCEDIIPRRSVAISSRHQEDPVVATEPHCHPFPIVDPERLHKATVVDEHTLWIVYMWSLEYYYPLDLARLT